MTRSLSTFAAECLQQNPMVLVVCTGNICRSAMAEVVLREKFRVAGLSLSVISRGISNEEQGNPIYPPARAVLSNAGYKLQPHSAKQVTSADITQAGLILAMTTGHARSLYRSCQATGVEVGKIHLWTEISDPKLEFMPFGCFTNEQSASLLEPSSSKSRNYRTELYVSNANYDVIDPWYGPDSGFQETLAVVEAGAENITKMLTQIRLFNA